MRSLFPESAKAGPWRGETVCDVTLNVMAGGDARADLRGGRLDAFFCGYGGAQSAPVTFAWDCGVVDFDLWGTRAGGLSGHLTYDPTAVSQKRARTMSALLWQLLRICGATPETDCATALRRLSRAGPAECAAHANPHSH
jgi:hypothetical protein